MENDPTPKLSLRVEGFFHELFLSSHTPRFDFVFGVVAPVLCLFFDPYWFRSRCYSIGMFAPYAPFWYTAIWLQIIALVVWIVYRGRIKYALGSIAGFFFVGAALWAILGGTLLLWTGPLLFVVCFGGSLALTPFLTCFVYLRNSLRASWQAQHQEQVLSRKFLVGAVLTGALFALAIPASVQWQRVPFPQGQIVSLLNDDSCKGPHGE